MMTRRRLSVLERRNIPTREIERKLDDLVLRNGIKFDLNVTLAYHKILPNDRKISSVCGAREKRTETNLDSDGHVFTRRLWSCWLYSTVLVRLNG